MTGGAAIGVVPPAKLARGARGSRDSLEYGKRAREQSAVTRGKGGERGDERGNAPLPAIVQQLRSARGRLHAHNALVGGVDHSVHEPFRLENHDQLRDGGGRTCSAFARSPSVMGPPKTMTERAESCGAGSPDDVVFAAEAAEEMQRRGVEAIGEVDGARVSRAGGGAGARGAWARRAGACGFRRHA